MAHNKSHIPHEIIEIILLRLSVKHLLRFKSVSKSWNTMISDPVFVQNHIRRSKSSNSDNLFLSHTSLWILSMSSSDTCYVPVIRLEDNKIQCVQEIECPYAGWKELCFCDGVILLTDGTYRRFALWNPSTRTSKELWHDQPCCRYGAFGLCRDPNTDDFKVVIVYWKYYWVYSSKNKSWIVLKEEYEIEYTGSRVFINHKSGVCVDGSSYWVSSSFGKARQKAIVYFDPRDDKFKILHKPENIVDDYRVEINVVELRGCLCLYHNNIDDKSVVEIWTNEKGTDNHSWNKLMTVENVNMWVWEFKPLCFVGNKIVVRKRGSHILLVYIPSEKRFEKFEHYTVGIFDSVSVPIPYIDSMFFLTEKPRSKTNRKRKCL